MSDRWKTMLRRSSAAVAMVGFYAPGRCVSEKSRVSVSFGGGLLCSWPLRGFASLAKVEV
jgi:hypothetical protein